MKRAGIYRFVASRGPNNPSAYYVGQAINVYSRERDHLRRLLKGNHNNPIFQAHFNKYGKESLEYQIMFICEKSKEILEYYEQRTLDFHISWYGGENIINIQRLCVTSRLGVPHSEKGKLNISNSLKGKGMPSHITRLAVSLAKRGVKLSPESIAKRTAKQRGVKRTQEFKDYLSFVMTGKTHNQETRDKISAGRSGWIPPPEHLVRLATMNIGRKHPPEFGQRISENKRGVPRPPGTLAKAWETRRRNAAMKDLIPE